MVPKRAINLHIFLYIFYYSHRLRLLHLAIRKCKLLARGRISKCALIKSTPKNLSASAFPKHIPKTPRLSNNDSFAHSPSSSRRMQLTRRNQSQIRQGKFTCTPANRLPSCPPPIPASARCDIRKPQSNSNPTTTKKTVNRSHFQVTAQNHHYRGCRRVGKCLANIILLGSGVLTD